MFFDNVRVLIFAHQNRVCSMLLEFLQIVEGVTELVIYVFWVFIGIIGGTPVKRISEGLFCTLYFFFVFGVLQALQGGTLINVFQRVQFDVFCFFCVVFIGILGGTSGKRIYEGLFCFLFFWGGQHLVNVFQRVELEVFFVCGFYRHYRGDP